MGGGGACGRERERDRERETEIGRGQEEWQPKGGRKWAGGGDIFGMLRVQTYRDHDNDCELSLCQ